MSTGRNCKLSLLDDRERKYCRKEKKKRILTYYCLTRYVSNSASHRKIVQIHLSINIGDIKHNLEDRQTE